MIKDKKVYIFDDDADILAICKILLETKGFTVFTSMDCTNLLEKIEAAQPNVIVMDNKIPDVGGVAATQLLKSNDSTRNIPVIFFSANTHIAKLAEEAGSEHYLQKPFDIDEFENLLEQALGV